MNGKDEVGDGVGLRVGLAGRNVVVEGWDDEAALGG